MVYVYGLYIVCRYQMEPRTYNRTKNKWPI